MSASNKIIFSLAQNLNINEKNQARKNIGAVGFFWDNTQSVSHVVTNDEAQVGTIKIPLQHYDSGVYLLDVRLYAGSGSNLGNTRIPLRVRFEYKFDGGSHSSSLEHTGALEQIDNDGPWYYGDTIRLRTNLGTLTGIDLEVYWGPWKIQANTSIDVTISYVLLSETEPI
jgi:hypothetical protein